MEVASKMRAEKLEDKEENGDKEETNEKAEAVKEENEEDKENVAEVFVKPKLDSEFGKKRKHVVEELDDDKSEHLQGEDDLDDENTVSGEESEEEKTSSEEEDENQDESKKQIVPEDSSSKTSAKKDAGCKIDEKSKAVGKGISVKVQNCPGNSTKKSSGSKSKHAAEPESKQKSDKKSEETSLPPKETSSSKKIPSKSSTKAVEKDQGLHDKWIEKVFAKYEKLEAKAKKEEDEEESEENESEKTSDDSAELYGGDYVKLKTRVIRKDVNPEWNEDLTLSVSDPSIPLQLTVYDHDTFSMDDKMGEAEFDIRPYIEALKMNLGGFPSGTIITMVQPSRSNCLAEESSVVWNDGKVLQDLCVR